MGQTAESIRVKTLKSYKILDTLPEKEYDDITLIASSICNTPICLVTFVDAERQFFKSHKGIDVCETPIELSFCAHAIKHPSEIFIVEDLTKDDRFRENPFVTEEPKLTFYAGVPLVTEDNVAIGTLCVLDTKPKCLNEDQIQTLKALANQVAQLLELRKYKFQSEKHQQILKERTASLNNIIEATRAGTWEWKVQSDEMRINDRWAEIVGYTLEELEPISIKTWFKLLHPDDTEASKLKLMECVEGGASYYEMECRMLHKEDYWVWVETRGKVTEWTADNKPLLISGTHTDVTDRKQIESQLRFSEQRFKSLVQEGADLIMILDMDGNYYYSSPTSRNILGYYPEEFIGRNADEFIHPDDKETFHSRFSKIKHSKRIAFDPFRYKHKEGHWIWIETVITNMLDDPAVNGLVSTSRDETERIESERKIKESEEKYHLLFQAGPFPKLIYVQETLEILDVNNSATEHYGYSREEFLEMEIKDLMLEREFPKLLKKIQQQQSTEGNIHFGIHTHKRKNGQIIKMDVTGHPIQLQQKNCMLIHCNDVSEREKTFQALQASEARYRGFYESQTNYVLRTDMEGKYTYVNKKFIKDFGWLYPDGKILGKVCLSSIEEYHHHRVFEVVEKCILSPGNVYKIELDKPAQEGGYVSTLWDFVCIADEYGNNSEIQCVGLDITDRIKFERALLESNERYEIVTKATNDAIWDWNVISNKVYRTGGFNKIFGYDEADIEENKNFWSRNIDPEYFDEVIDSQRKVLENPNENYWESEYPFQRKDGSYAFVYDRGYVLRDEHGNANRMIGAVQDITYRKEYENSLRKLNSELAKHSKELEISNQELEQFAYVASHDLQEPLRMITSFLTQLDRKYNDQLDDKANQYIYYAVDGAKRMREIILDLLKYSQVGRFNNRKEKIDLNQLIADYKILRRHLIKEKSASIDIIGDAPVIFSYKAPLIQVFHNLLDNALKYSKEDVSTQIKIKGTEKGAFWEFSVEDNSIGIDEAYFDRIFIVFQRLHTKDQYSGTGMGLAIVKKIIENLGGTIWVESKEGVGSTFHFTIQK